MKLLGVTLGAIAACEANPRFSIRFSIKDASAISAELLENAIENAKWKADILAKSAGVNLGEILRIDYSWSEHHFYSNTDMKVAEDMLYLSEAAPMAVDIEPDDINVSDTATVVWAIA